MIYPETYWQKNNHLAMLSDSVGQEFRQSLSETACLCSMVIGASAGETPELGMTQWQGAGDRLALTLMLACYLGLQLSSQLEHLHVGPCVWSFIKLFGLLYSMWLHSKSEHPKESQWELDHL